MKAETKSYFFAFSAILLWSTVASAFKLTLTHIDHLQLLFLASFSSCIVLFVIITVTGKLKGIRLYTGKQLLVSALLGLINPCIYYIILFKAYALLPAQEAQPLNYTWPIMLVLLSSLILKQKLTIKGIIAIIISFSGVLIISTHGNILTMRFSNLTGALLALASSVIWALFWILNTRDDRDPVIKLFLNFLAGFIYIAIITLIFSEIKFFPLPALLGAGYIGLFEMGITFIFWLLALKYTKNTARISNLVYLSPFLSLFFIRIFVKEKILISTIIGLIFIIWGIILQQVSIKKKKIVPDKNRKVISKA